jgi:hypothetical protein
MSFALNFARNWTFLPPQREGTPVKHIILES